MGKYKESIEFLRTVLLSSEIDLATTFGWRWGEVKKEVEQMLKGFTVEFIKEELNFDADDAYTLATRNNILMYLTAICPQDLNGEDNRVCGGFKQIGGNPKDLPTWLWAGGV